jgi:hypothetical protein
MVNGALNKTGNCAYANGVFSWRRALAFQTRDIATSGGLPRQRACPYQKDFGWMAFLGVEPRSVVALAEGLCDLGRGDHFGRRPPWVGRRAVPLLNYTLAFALQLRKSTENLSRCSRLATGLLVAPTWLSFEGQPRLACCTSVHLGCTGDFSQPSVGISAFRVAEIRGSPHQLTSSRNSQSVLWWCRRRMESPDPG